MRATKVNAGLAESNGRLLLGIWCDSLHVTYGLTACTPGSAPGPTHGNEYGKTLPSLPLPVCMSVSHCVNGHFSVCLPVCLYACVSVSLSACMSVYACVSVSLSACMSLCMPVRLSSYLSVCLFLCLSVYVFVCMSGGVILPSML